MKTILQTCAFIILLCITFFFCSCLIPIYSPSRSLRDRIDISNIKPGITTKEEIFLNLGNPFNRVSDDEKLFAATFGSRGGSGLLVVVAAGYSAGGFKLFDKTMIDVYELEIEFDDHDVVKRCEIFQEPRKSVDKITY